MDACQTCATQRPTGRLARPARSWWGCLFLALGAPTAALAQLDFPVEQPPLTHFIPYADGEWQHNSNLFALSDSSPRPAGRDGPSLSDSWWEERAGFDAVYEWSLQEIFATAEFRHFSYDQFTQLNHNEYLVHAGWNWKVASLLDGVIDYQRQRSMESFLQLNAMSTASDQLYLQVQDIATANINLQVTPEWRLQSLGKLNDQNTQLPGTPDLTLHEESIHEGLRYVGFANLSAGLDAEYLRGTFNGGAFLVTPGYRQGTAEFAADYVLSGLSSFHGAIGYTDRVMEQAGRVSGLTGLLSYQRQLTGKTSFVVKLSRAINTYITAASPEVDTAAELDVTWAATSKIEVDLGYQWLHSSFSATDLAGVLTAARTDRLQTPSLSVKYQPLKWLLVHPFFQYQKRSSTIDLFTFNGTLYGIELEGRLPFE